MARKPQSEKSQKSEKSQAKAAQQRASRKTQKPASQVEPGVSHDDVVTGAAETFVVDTTIPSLGESTYPNPLPTCHFVEDTPGGKVSVPVSVLHNYGEGVVCVPFETAGPRQKLFFDPSKTKCAIVTCGGLCPGINDVVRSIVLEAHYTYNMAACLGIRFGLRGFIPSFGYDYVELTPESVSGIHQFGGTVLGSSRGPQPPDEIVDALERMNVGVLFMIGGDGTMRAMQTVVEEIARRKLSIAVIGIPKTIDNDIPFVNRSFGFDTAVEQAAEAILSAHVEAKGAFNGVGMVKLMGRHSGFIAAQATLAIKEVNFVLVPEHRFELEGEHGLLPALEERLSSRHHAVIVVAEGAGQHLCGETGERDPSGNVKLADICATLQGAIKEYLGRRGLRYTLKFIDPSYIIRSVPANANDRVYCGFLGLNAVHAALAGKTGMVVTKLQDRYVHLPVDLVTSGRKTIDTSSGYWRAVLETTGQTSMAKPGGFHVPVCSS